MTYSDWSSLLKSQYNFQNFNQEKNTIVIYAMVFHKTGLQQDNHLHTAVFSLILLTKLRKKKKNSYKEIRCSALYNTNNIQPK